MSNRIPFYLAVPPEVTTEYAGTQLGAYYTDGPTMLRTQLEARKRFRERFGVAPIGVGSDPPAYIGVAVLGADLVFPLDDPPQIRGHPLGEVAAIDRLELPEDYYETPAMRPYWEIYQWMKTQVQEPVGLGAGVEGPITSATLLRGQDFFSDLYLHPAAAHRLLDLVTESYIQFVRANRRRRGEPELQGGVGLCDDFAGLVSPAMWPEFVVPYYERIYAAFGDGPRGMHSELLRPGHLRFLLHLGVTSFDPGQDQYLTLQSILEAAPGLYFTWNVPTIRYMKEGTPQSIAAFCRHAIAEGAPALMAEPCRGSPPENIEAFLAVGREFGNDF